MICCINIKRKSNFVLQNYSSTPLLVVKTKICKIQLDLTCDQEFFFPEERESVAARESAVEKGEKKEFFFSPFSRQSTPDHRLS